MNLTVTPVTAPVGGSTTFAITGGPPFASLAWSSILNGVDTGEHQVSYGQQLDATGNWSAVVAWPAVLNGVSTVGHWEKTVYAVAPDGSLQTAAAGYTITAPSSSTPGPVSSGGLLEGNYNIAGYSIPKIGVYLSIAALALLVIPSGGGGRR